MIKIKNRIIKIAASVAIVLSVITAPVVAFASPPKYHCGLQMQYTTASWTGSYNHYHGITQYYCHVTYVDTAYYYTCVNCGATSTETVRSNEVHTRV